MHSATTRMHLDMCRQSLADADVSDELRQLANDLLDRLVSMHEAHRMNGPVFLLALDSLELVPGLEASVQALRTKALRDFAT